MIKSTILAVILSCICTTSFAFTNMIYTDGRLSAKNYNNNALLFSIKKNHEAIQILAPQVYKVDENGTVWGSVSHAARRLCKRENIKIMPLVTNVSFDQDKFHQLLQNPDAMNRAVAQLINACHKNHFMGIQFDIENISVNDKNAYSQFIANAANQFHQHHLAISVAIVPSQVPADLNSGYEAWVYNNWSGGYDIKALAKACDFVTIMAYDRHTTLTTPGPIAPLPWVKLIMKNALAVAPANKLMLGIPFYSGYWVTELKGDHYQSREHQIRYQSVLNIQRQFKTKAKWDSESATSLAILHHRPGGLYNYLFVQNASSVKAALSYAKTHKLKGISAWKLREEDPKVWPLLINDTKGKHNAA